MFNGDVAEHQLQRIGESRVRSSHARPHRVSTKGDLLGLQNRHDVGVLACRYIVMPDVCSRLRAITFEALDYDDFRVSFIGHGWRKCVLFETITEAQRDALHRVERERLPFAE